jgi:prepilin-type N-terminal cleavage/methylation domain-containing protein
MLKPKTHKSGFTLLEILLVVGIIAILAGIVIVAINPSRQLATARDTERRSDLKQINNALLQYYIDNQKFPTSVVSDTLAEICNSGSGDGDYCPDETIDLSVLVPKYLSAIPTDPKGSTATTTGYHIALNSSHKPYLKAPNTEIPGTYIAIGSGEGVMAPCDHSTTNPSCWSADNITNGRIAWSNEYIDTGARSTIDGVTNTETLMALSGDDPSKYPAAYACANLTENGYEDWYLPAKQQLKDAYDGNVSGFNQSPKIQSQQPYYWSSSDHYPVASYEFPQYGFAHVVDMTNGIIMGATKTDSLFIVRCLR